MIDWLTRLAVVVGAGSLWVILLAFAMYGLIGGLCLLFDGEGPVALFALLTGAVAGGILALTSDEIGGWITWAMA